MEEMFNQISKDDLEKMNLLVSKGYFETTDFREQVEVLANSLSVLLQITGDMK